MSSPFLSSRRSFVRYAVAAVCVVVVAFVAWSSSTAAPSSSASRSPSLQALHTTLAQLKHDAHEHAKSRAVAVAHGPDRAEYRSRSSDAELGPRRPVASPPHWTTDPDDDDDDDENYFDESHQRDLVRMYSSGGGGGGGGAAAAASGSDEDNPYSFPGMSPNEGPDEWDYAITIDCGSKGTRAHIYKWQHRHSASSIPPFSPVFTKHAWSMRVSPGISTFVHDPSLVEGQLATLLEFARNSLSSLRHKWNRTPVYVKATAGMRLVRNLPSRDRIMETVRSYLSDVRRNPFYFERTMARVISGEEEGVYGWMTANYLSGTLMRASSATSYGALDMGGASVQITFRPPFDVLSNYFPLRMRQERIRLYTHSFLNFGIERALERVNDRIIELGNATTTPPNGAAGNAEGASSTSGGSGGVPELSGFFIGWRDGVRVFRHPCFPLGFSFTYTYVRTTDLAASFGGQRTGFVGDADDGADLSPVTTYSEAMWAREMVQFEGGQNPSNCTAITWALLHKKAACFDNTCSFDGIYQPRFGNVTFLAFSEFSKVVVGDLGLRANATLAEIDHRTREVCQWNWQHLQDTYRYAKVDDLAKMCFNARYVFTVLYKGFGFPYRGQNLRFVRSLLDLDLSWALGSTLYEANAMPFDVDRPRAGDEAYRFHLGEGNARAEDTPEDHDADGIDDADQNENVDSRPPPTDKHELKRRYKEEKKEMKAEEKKRSDKARARQRRHEAQRRRDEAAAAAVAATRHNSRPPARDEDVGGDADDDDDLPRRSSTRANTSSPAGVMAPSGPFAPVVEKESPWSSTSVWGVIGFLVGGWVMTTVAFCLALRSIRAESGLRYEALREAALP